MQETIDKLSRALVQAAVDALTEYKARCLYGAMIGPGKLYESDQAWIDARIAEWMGEEPARAVPQALKRVRFLESGTGQWRDGVVVGENQDRRTLRVRHVTITGEKETDVDMLRCQPK